MYVFSPKEIKHVLGIVFHSNNNWMPTFTETSPYPQTIFASQKPFKIIQKVWHHSV